VVESAAVALDDQVSLQIAVTLAVLFVFYRYLVRATFIGATLNGRRYPRSLPIEAAQPSEAT
jgi:hypothetical protein